jgi:hypothetical protein
MIASLLPGLRDVRAPLAAGYTWLLAMFVAFWPTVPTSMEATGVWRTLNDFADILGRGGLVLAASALAYVVGTISQGVFGRHALGHEMRWWLRGKLRTRSRAGAVVQRVTSAGMRRHILAVDPASTRMPCTSRGTSAVRAAARARVHDLRSLLADSGVPLQALAAAAASQESDRSSDQADSRWTRLLAVSTIVDGLIGSAHPPPRRRDIDAWEDGDLEDSLEQSIAQDAMREAELSRVGLVGAEPELFSAIDRLHAEAEFRIALAPPMLGLALALGWRASWWAAPTLGLAAVILMIQGRDRRRQGNDAMLEALRVGRTRIPLFDEIDAAIRESRVGAHGC